MQIRENYLIAENSVFPSRIIMILWPTRITTGESLNLTRSSCFLYWAIMPQVNWLYIPGHIWWRI